MWPMVWCYVLLVEAVARIHLYLLSRKRPISIGNVVSLTHMGWLVYSPGGLAMRLGMKSHSLLTKFFSFYVSFVAHVMFYPVFMISKLHLLEQG